MTGLRVSSSYSVSLSKVKQYTFVLTFLKVFNSKACKI